MGQSLAFCQSSMKIFLMVVLLSFLGVAKCGLFGLHGGHYGRGYGYGGYGHGGYGHGGYGHHHHGYSSHHHDYHNHHDYYHRREAPQSQGVLVERSPSDVNPISPGFRVKRSALAEPIFGLFGRYHHHHYPLHYGHSHYYW